MDMFRCLTLTAACVGLQLVDPASFEISNGLPFGFQQVAVVQFLKLGLAAWATVELNAVLNRWAENRWKWQTDKDDWNWPSEVAVVTGGAAGIGACVVKKLVSHGIKVAVLDVGPLSDQVTDGE